MEGVTFEEGQRSVDFNNKLAQGFYGIFEIMKKRRLLLWIDVGAKVIGLVTALTVYPPAMMFSVIIAAGFLMGGIRVMRLDWDHMQ